MRAYLTLFVLSLIVNPLGMFAQGVVQIYERLIGCSEYMADAKFEVLLPSHEEPVTYDLTLQSQAVDDSLAPCDYLIRWSAESPSGPISGFSAYFDGNHYRYRNNRLQEYHTAANASVFAPAGAPDPTFQTGVQNQAQFADLLPQYLGHKLQQMASDTCYCMTLHPDTIVQGQRAVAIDGVKRTAGFDSQYFTYAFDPTSLLPLYIDIETSPGSISEQIITVRYSGTASLPALTYSEDALMEQWPEVFEKYRESTFGVENLPGTPLPQFSCPLLNSADRMTHQRGQTLTKPAIFVALDPDVSTSRATIQAVRDAIDMLPGGIDVVWAMRSNHADEIETLLGEMLPEEKVMTSANTFARNCGITLYPSMLFVDSDGVVQNVAIGYNADLTPTIIEKALPLK